MKKILSLLILLSALFSNAQTTRYYGPSGSNTTGNGTIGNPYATLSHTVSVSSSGDICHQLAGIVIEAATVILPTGISVEAADTTAILRGTMTGQFVAVIQMHDNEGTNGNQSIRNIKFDGNNRTSSWGVSIRGRSNVTIIGCVFRNFEETAVNWSGRNDGVQAAPTIYSTGNVFINNILVNCATFEGAYGRGAFQFGGQDGMLIYNNFIKTDERPAGQDGWPIKGCNDSWFKNCIIRKNTLINAPFPYTANGQNNYWDFAMELFDNLGGNLIDSNIMYGSLDINRQQKGTAAFSVRIADNVIGFPTQQAGRQSGIILEYSTPDAIVERNYIRNTTEGIIFSTRGGSAITNTVLRNNRISGLGLVAGGYGDGIAVHDDGSNNYTVDGLFIYNNTLRCVSNASQAGIYAINFSSARTINNWRVRNNIVIGFQEATIWSNVTDSISNSFFTNNYLFGNLRNTPFTNFAGTRTLPAGNTLANNTLAVDPLLVTNDTLAVASPCIDAGVDVSVPFAGTAPDVGYWERGSVGGGDITPPTVVSTNPTNGATGVASGALTITINFDGAMNTGTLNNTNITGIGGTITPGSTFASIAATLLPSTTYTITVNGVQDLAGNTMAAPYVFTFTTAAAQLGTPNEIIIKILKN
jgi:hypothetical protein